MYIQIHPHKLGSPSQTIISRWNCHATAIQGPRVKEFKAAGGENKAECRLGRVKQTMRRQNAMDRHRIQIKAAKQQHFIGNQECKPSCKHCRCTEKHVSKGYNEQNVTAKPGFLSVCVCIYIYIYTICIRIYTYLIL